MIHHLQSGTSYSNEVIQEVELDTKQISTIRLSTYCAILYLMHITILKIGC